MLDQAIEALKTYDWGVDPKVLRPIDDAIVAAHGNGDGRKELETQLAAVLGSEVPRAAKAAVCRALKTIGTAASVPALAKLLTDEKLSHMARYALEAIPGPEATRALVETLDSAPDEIKIGIASSLGSRARSTEISAKPLARTLAQEDPAVARAGALALGALGSAEAAAALGAVAATKTNAATKAAIADGLLECAENLLAAGNKAGAKAAYENVLASNLSEAANAAATLGIKATS